MTSPLLGAILVKRSTKKEGGWVGRGSDVAAAPVCPTTYDFFSQGPGTEPFPPTFILGLGSRGSQGVPRSRIGLRRQCKKGSGRNILRDEVTFLWLNEAPNIFAMRII